MRTSAKFKGRAPGEIVLIVIASSLFRKLPGISETQVLNELK